jgi:LysM repeat protein
VLRSAGRRWHRATTAFTASVTSGGIMLLGMPVALDYVVRPGDTLSEIAQRHGTSVERLVARNDLHRSGDQVVAGQTLRIPAAHGRPAASGRARISPDARKIVRYTVRPGDTPSGLAVRFRAWTDEVIERNGPVLHVGEQVEIPVVLAAVARDRRAAPAPSGGSQPSAGRATRSSDTGPSRATVRRVIAATARRHGVDPDLALAVSWQEAGWQMHHVSSADAIGAMQVIPATGEWMSGLVGRDLDLHDLQDNATAGVVLLKVLRQQARTRVAVAGYYQGLAGVREHGMYDDTKRYVANVMALKGRFEGGEYPD